MTEVLLAIDQGTTSSRAIGFAPDGEIQTIAQQEFTQYFPRPGWVEHDPDEIWSSTVAVCQNALDAMEGHTILAAGITNQRETTIVWNRATGKAVYNAIVWQDRRTADYCAELRAAGHEPTVSAKTGLVLDPYFSASKIAWILDNVTGARAAAEKGELAFGTVDTFLIWRLTGGAVHATDATNASRTMLFNIHEQRWDDELLAMFSIPAALLPDVRDCAADYGITSPGVLSQRIQLAGVAGDQQAATVGQACFAPGEIKSTYGTGCFAVMNTGKEVIRSQHHLLSTVAYRLGGEVTYALEGSIFVAGAAVQWLRDGLGIIASADETESLTTSLSDNEGVYLVPAFTGLGAPYWDPDARGAIVGLTRDTGPAHFARAALEAVGYQTHDLLVAMNGDSTTAVATLRVDGGMTRNPWLLQFLSDISDTRVERPAVVETTALGAAYLAGLHIGRYASLEDIATQWRSDAAFEPSMDAERRSTLVAGWRRAVASVVNR